MQPTPTNDLLVNLTPTVDVSQNPTPSEDLLVNISPTVDVESA